MRDDRKCKVRETVDLLVDFDPLFVCREHTARVMETVRAINAGKTSRRSRKIGAHNHQNASTAKDGPDFNFTLPDTAVEARGGGEGASHSQEGKSGAGSYRTAIN